MPDTRHLMIYPPTFCNVSYSWNYVLTSHHEHMFKEVTSPSRSSYPPKSWEQIVNTAYYFFTLSNTLDDHTYVHQVQQDTCLYNLQDLEPEELTERKRIKKNQARRRKMQRIRERAEKLVQLKRELQLIHKQSRTESGTMGIVCWNWEYWDTGMGLKRLRTLENGQKVKKEEPLTPLFHIKVESPPTPCLHYPPSSLSSSHFCSIDPNDFKWSNSPTP